MRWSLLLTLAVLLVAAPARALDWGGIVPGETTTDQVRATYGAPSKTTTEKIEGYDTTQWIYEGTRAPSGIKKLTVEFGLKIQDRYRADIVRAVRLEPRPGVFTRPMIVTGWGSPSFWKADKGVDQAFFYPEGLVVYFDKDGYTANLMLFTTPQLPPSLPAEKKP